MATVQAYTKSGVDAKFNSRSNMTMVHGGGGSPDISAYPDAKTGDVIERSSDGARWGVVASSINPIAGRVVSVGGKTGVVTLGPGDVGAAPSGHTHTKAQITDLNASTSATSNSIAQRGTGGVLNVGTPTYSEHATTKAYVDSRVAGGITWANLSGKPTTFPPSSHTHTVSNITDLNISYASTGNTVAIRDADGRIRIGNPTVGEHAATKSYVDSQTTDINTSYNPDGDTVVIRDANGRIRIGGPTVDEHAATKKYVDDKAAVPVTWSSLSGKPSTFTPSSHTHTVSQISDIRLSVYNLANAVVQRTDSGHIRSPLTPVGLEDSTSKSYVDKQITASKTWSAITDKPSVVSNISGSTTDAGSLLSLSANGRLGAVNPSGATDVANKQYVDSQISEKTTWANTSGKPATFPPSSHTHTISQITGLTLSQGATGNSVAQRDSSGRVTVATPSATGHATTKAYVDNAVTAGKAWAAITGKPSSYTPSSHNHTISQITDLNVSYSATGDTVAIRDGDGRIRIGGPTLGEHAATKSYVDSQIPDPNTSYNPDGNTVVIRDANGRIRIGDPTVGEHSATKSYVDTAVTSGKAWSAITGKPSTFPPSSHNHTVDQITDLKLSTFATGGTVVKRSEYGQVRVPLVPVWEDDASAKSYVDSKFISDDLTTQDLNSIVTPGNHFQGLSSNATTDRNYPPNAMAGHLVVIQGGDYVKQEYTDFDAGSMYYRTKYSDTWYPWQSITQSTA